MPGREKPLHLQSVTELWGSIIGFPIFFGMLFGALLVVDVPVDKTCEWLCILLPAAGFLGFCGFAGSGPRLAELAQRGEWVPPGANRHPALLGIVLGLFLLAVGAAVVVSAVWIAGKGDSAYLRSDRL